MNKGFNKNNKGYSVCKKLKTNKGITLVALIITIVVMLILVAVSVNLIIKSNLIGIAEGTTTKYSQEAEREGNQNGIKVNGKDLNHYVKKAEGNNEPEWKSKTLEERVEMVQNTQGKMYIFKDISETEKVKKGVCKCGQVENIFNKAVELGLVETYTEQETQEGTKYTEVITANLEESSLVFYEFICRSEEQVLGGTMPMAFSVNYETTIDFENWFDFGKPNFHKPGGDFERMLAWLDENYAETGFTIMKARASMYIDDSLTKIGQIYHQKIQVVSKTNFVKAIKELGLDLSAYDGVCSHPVK